MAQLAIYLDDRTAREIKKQAKRAGVSRSEWVSQAVKKELSQKIPEEFFQVLGSWQDDRSPEQILKEIKKEKAQTERAFLR